MGLRILLDNIIYTKFPPWILQMQMEWLWLGQSQSKLEETFCKHASMWNGALAAGLSTWPLCTRDPWPEEQGTQSSFAIPLISVLLHPWDLAWHWALGPISPESTAVYTLFTTSGFSSLPLNPREAFSVGKVTPPSSNHLPSHSGK
jgi:hypothetical protein